MADKVEQYTAVWDTQDNRGGFDVRAGNHDFGIGADGPEEFAAILLMLKTKGVTTDGRKIIVEKAKPGA